MKREEAIEEIKQSIGKPSECTSKALLDDAEILSTIISDAVGHIDTVEVPSLVVALAMVQAAVINAYPGWNKHGTLDNLIEGAMKNK